MKKFNLFMTIFIVSMLLIGCASKTEDIEIKFLNEGQVMSTEGFQTYTVEIKDKAGKAIDVEKVYLYTNMKMMNHPIEGTMKRVDTGLYQLDLPLAMAGDWYANITVTKNGKELMFEDLPIIAEGPKQLEYIKGYNADNQ